MSTAAPSYDSKSIRTATVARKTAETNITCTISLDHAPGVKQAIDIKTGIGFLDHVSLLLRLHSPTSSSGGEEEALPAGC
jgi:imidazoleglycerol-phosphate dehydratase